jgi:hypothetical protein
MQPYFVLGLSGNCGAMGTRATNKGQVAPFAHSLLLRTPLLRTNPPVSFDRALPRPMFMFRLATAATCLATAAGHGCITFPTSRNAVDAHEVSCDAGTDGCSSKAVGDGCVNATHPGEPCMNGQASFYYSQGCFIGCPEWCAPTVPSIHGPPHSVQSDRGGCRLAAVHPSARFGARRRRARRPAPLLSVQLRASRPDI